MYKYLIIKKKYYTIWLQHKSFFANADSYNIY